MQPLCESPTVQKMWQRARQLQPIINYLKRCDHYEGYTIINFLEKEITTVYIKIMMTILASEIFIRSPYDYLDNNN